MQIDILFSFIGATILLAIMPGPDIIYVILQSISQGKKYGFITALGLSTGVIIHTTLVALGVSTIIKQSESLYFGIKIFGAIYLFYLAYLSGKEHNSSLLKKDKLNKSGLFQLYKQGFIMNVLNPKVTLFFLAFLPQFLFSKELSIKLQLFILGGLFMMVTIIVFGIVSVTAGKFSKLLESKKSMVYLKWIKVFVFIAIGFYILFTA
jgi:threonine/homoserine/homoserine lactone efflux protein